MIQKLSLYAYTGDLVLQDTANLEKSFFLEFGSFCEENNTNLVVNLESPFVEKSYIRVKDKICLGATSDTSFHLSVLKPFLVNLSNNHINDFGNAGVDNTYFMLKEMGLKYFGVGLRNHINNIHHSDDNVINIAFTLRSADQSGSVLFATDELQGPNDIDLAVINKLKRDYPKKKIIASVHWGYEDISIPDPETRNTAKLLIDNGVDLIIGHHPHIIQPLEIYKGKMIFYSLGNFFFPPIKYEFRGREYVKKPALHQRLGIIPIFCFADGVELVKLLKVENNGNSLSIKEINSESLIKNNIFYSFFSTLYNSKEFIRLAKYYPKRIIEKILICVKLKKN